MTNQDKTIIPTVKPGDWSITGLKLLPSQELFLKQSSKLKLDLGRFLHLVDEERREDFTKLFLNSVDQTDKGVFRGNLRLIEEFSNRAFEFLSEYLDLLATKQLKGGRKESRKEVIQVLSQTFVQFERAFRMLVRTLKIKEVKLGEYEEKWIIEEYLPFLLSGDIWGLLKHQSCIFWNIHLNSNKEEFPTHPLYDQVRLFLGNRLIKKFLRRGKKDHFVQYTVFQGFKKCLPPLALPLVRRNFQGLKKDLTQQPPDFDRERIRRYIGELYIKTSEPSLSYTYGASFSCSRSKGGQLQELLEAYRVAHPSDRFITPIFRGFSLDTQSGRIESVYLEGPDFKDVEDWWWSRCSLMSSPFPYEGQVIPLGILEPLKVRPITKGDAMTLCGLEFVKQDLRRSLRAIPNGVFDLIFGSINEDDSRLSAFYDYREWGGFSLLDVAKKDNFQGRHNLGWESEEELYFNSGDFTAATNKCNGDMSLYVFEEFARRAGYTPEVVTRATRSLLGSTIHYSNEKCLPFRDYGHEAVVEETEEYSQITGQLMGSVVSFPILCLLNLFCYWQSVELWLQRQISLTELVLYYPVRINGDDILFCGTKELISIWNKTLPEYGFSKSLGKNLVLQDAFTINSVYFTFSDGLVQRRDYLNMGLLNGVKKGDGANDTIARSFSAESREFLETVYREDFWRAAAEAYLEICTLPKTSLIDRAKKEFLSVYSPYLEEQGWTFLEWDLNYDKVLLIPSTPLRHTFFPHNHLNDQEPQLFILDRAYEIKILPYRKRLPVKILDPGELRELPSSTIATIIMERFINSVVNDDVYVSTPSEGY